MSDDTYPEELYVAEIEILDYDEVYEYEMEDIPPPDEWEGDYYVEHDEPNDDYVDVSDWEEYEE